MAFLSLVSLHYSIRVDGVVSIGIDNDAKETRVGLEGTEGRNKQRADEYQSQNKSSGSDEVIMRN